MQRCKHTNKEGWADLLATKIAELKLSELGYRFIPNITPSFVREKKFIEARAYIVKNETSLINEANKERVSQ